LREQGDIIWIELLCFFKLLPRFIVSLRLTVCQAQR
jgi:hypothetical protein